MGRFRGGRRTGGSGVDDEADGRVVVACDGVGGAAAGTGPVAGGAREGCVVDGLLVGGSGGGGGAGLGIAPGHDGDAVAGGALRREDP